MCRTNQPSSEHTVRREGLRHNSSSNGSSRLGVPSQNPQRDSFSALSPKSPDYVESDYGDNSELDRRYILFFLLSYDAIIVSQLKNLQQFAVIDVGRDLNDIQKESLLKGSQIKRRTLTVTMI